MREAFATRANFSDVTWPPFTNVTTTFTFDVINCCTLGVPLYLIIVYLSFASKKVDGDFKYFLGNLAVAQLGYCFGNVYNWALHLYYAKNGIQLNAIMCRIQISIPYGFGFATVLALPLLPFNRYCVVVLKSKWFTKPHIFLLCCVPYCIGFFGEIYDILFAKFVTFYPRCGYEVYTPFIPEFIVIPGFIGYGTTIFCYFKVHKIVATHMRASRRSRGGSSHVLCERSVLKASVYQACVPLICVLPVSVYLLSVMLFGWLATEFVLIHVGPFHMTVDDICFGTMMFLPTATALVTLLVVKPYKEAMRPKINAVRKFFRFSAKVSSRDTTRTVHETGLTPNML